MSEERDWVLFRRIVQRHIGKGDHLALAEMRRRLSKDMSDATLSEKTQREAEKGLEIIEEEINRAGG